MSESKRTDHSSGINGPYLFSSPSCVSFVPHGLAKKSGGGESLQIKYPKAANTRKPIAKLEGTMLAIKIKMGKFDVNKNQRNNGRVGK